MSINIQERHNVNCVSTDELLPCPFCGSEPKMDEKKETIDGYDFSYFTIYCENGQCTATGDCQRCYCWIEETSKKRAIKRWNTRLVLFIGATEYIEYQLSRDN